MKIRINKIVNRFFIYFFCSMTICGHAYASGTHYSDVVNIPTLNKGDVAAKNLERAIQLVNQTLENHFSDEGMEMGRFYNPFTKVRSKERGSVWMYGASIEAVNAILHGLKLQKEKGNLELYNKYFVQHSVLLNKLYDDAAYYLGTFDLISYTQKKEWTVYAVDRVNKKGKANVTGVLNVYDDQMWLIREFIDAYKITGQKFYLDHAEYLTEYVLDGWDVSRDSAGNELGGIPWGPGYVTKHACSNGPMISPLVWLHELYKGKSDKIEHRFIDAKNRVTRKTKTEKKSDYYLKFAERLYDWQKKYLLSSDGVYTDMMGGCKPDCKINYEIVNGVQYRAGTKLTEAVGRAYSYNSGTMLSGAADLYRVTKKKEYLTDASKLSKASFQYFAKLDETLSGYYSFANDGFNNWFNGVLLRGYLDVLPLDKQTSSYIDAFQKNLDYGYEKYLFDGYLPTDLLKGWDQDKRKNDVEAMFMFTYAAQYAVLAQYELAKKK